MISILVAAALAGYCGPRADTKAVETLTVQRFNATRHAGWKAIDRSYIMAIVVDGPYAESDVQYAGQMSMYFQKKNGAWVFAGNFPPKAWPDAVTSRLAALFNQRSAGSKQCTNPNFVPRPSGQ